MYVRLANVNVTNTDGTLDVKITLEPESQITPEGIRAQARLIDNPGIERVLAGERPVGRGQFAWAMSGVIPVIDTADGPFVVLGERDGDAPSYPHHLTTAAGFAETPAELFTPRTIAAREGIEEILYCDHSGTTYVPNVSQIQLDDIRTNIVGTRRDKWNQAPDDVSMLAEPAVQPPVSLEEFETVEAELSSLGDDTVTIVDPESDEMATTTGNIVLDPNENTMDIIDVMRVDLSHCSLDDLFLLDGDLDNGDILNRDIYLFTPDQLKETWTTGQGEYHRRFKSGHCWTGDEWASSAAEGEHGTVNPFEPVPNLDRTLDAFFDELG